MSGNAPPPRALLAAVLCLPLWACLLVPTPEHGLLEGRGALTAEETAVLTPGATSREEVLLRFGEPDVALEGERVLAYEWAVVHGYYFVGAYYTGTGGPIPKRYLLLLAFDESGVLERWEVQASIVHDPMKLVRQWAATAAAPPAPAAVAPPP